MRLVRDSTIQEVVVSYYVQDTWRHIRRCILTHSESIVTSHIDCIGSAEIRCDKCGHEDRMFSVGEDLWATSVHIAVDRYMWGLLSRMEPVEWLRLFCVHASIFDSN